jgi:glutamine amidotransferase
MCLLTVIPEGVQPNKKHLYNGTVINNDGHGFAVIVDGEIVIGRYLSAITAVERFANIRANHPEGPAIFHSRMATHGSTTKDNIHPFVVGGDRTTVVAHNGILPTVFQPDKKDKRSDTRIIAEQWLTSTYFNKHYRFHTRNGRNRLARLIGTYNKLAVLTTNPAYPKNLYIVNEREGIWHPNGCWYSNNGYLPYSPYRAMGVWHSDGTESWYRSEPDKKYVYLDCDICLTDDAVNPDTKYCDFCKSCNDCYESTENCECWLPTYIRASKAITDKPDKQLTEDEWQQVLEDFDNSVKSE